MNGGRLPDTLLLGGARSRSHLLQQSFGLPGRIIRTEVLVLIHLFLNGEKLALEFVSQAWQGVSDVICQLLHK